MDTLYYDNLAILAKAEATYRTDAVPTAAANAMLMTNVTITRLAGSEVTRDLMLPFRGHQGVFFAAQYMEIQADVEMAGAGTAGDVPAYGPLLESLGTIETITAGTKVEYTPAARGADRSVSIYANWDGVRHVMLGVRSTMTFDTTPSTLPKYRFTLRGLVGSSTDVAFPAANFTGFIEPQLVTPENTTLSVHGLAAPGERFAFDAGNDLQLRERMNNEKSIEIVQRRTVGTAVMEAQLLATKDWPAIIAARTLGAVVWTHGTGAGHIVELAAPAVQIGRESYGQAQGIKNNTLPLMFKPVAGNDEWKLTIR